MLDSKTPLQEAPEPPDRDLLYCSRSRAGFRGILLTELSGQGSGLVGGLEEMSYLSEYGDWFVESQKTPGSKRLSVDMTP